MNGVLTAAGPVELVPLAKLAIGVESAVAPLRPDVAAMAARLDWYDQGLGRIPYAIRGFRIHFPRIGVCQQCGDREFRLDGEAAKRHHELTGHPLVVEERPPWKLPKE